MIADKLDPEAEKRIREACPYHSRGEPLYLAQCWWCGLLRAAIQADREAHACHHEEDARIACMERDAADDVANAERKDRERAEDHADALADALRFALPYVEMQAAVLRDVQDSAAVQVRAHVTIGRSALAAHDALRGR